MNKLREMDLNIQQLGTMPVANTPVAQTSIAEQDMENLSEQLDVIEIEYEKLPEVITLAKLRQQLLEIRKQIYTEFNLSDDANNILSSATIDEIILLGVQKLNEWKKLPTTSNIQITQNPL